MRTFLRVLAVVGLVVVLVVSAVGLYGVHLVRASFPQTSGEIVVPGLAAAVTVQRDSLGIPQIYGDSFDDVSFAEGYVHAQDRFWEMDVRRHITSGRLSEMFGASQVPTDTFLRTLGWRRVAEQEVGMLSARSRRALDAYSAGVNAYLATRHGEQLSLEYAVLALQNPTYAPEPWQPADSVAWLKAMAWDLRSNIEDEISRSIMSAAVGVEQTEKLYPPYPYERHRPIVEGGAVVNGVFDAAATPAHGSRGAAVPARGRAVSAIRQVSDAAALLEPWLGRFSREVGSNSWAVAGAHTESGKPLLANDPHLAPAMPSLWYQLGLHCTTRTADCDLDVTGWTMAGLPGIFIGHNDTVAWGFTNLGPDVADLVLERVDGDTYLLDGEQVPLTTRQETIEVAGGEPVVVTVRSTVDGPIVSDVPDVEQYPLVGADAPAPPPGASPTADPVPPRDEGYAVALRWTALTPSTTYDAFDLLNNARSWEQFRQAAARLAVPAQNMLYADTEGNIGYQAPGRIPIREGYDGRWPVPGWDSRYQWQGFIDTEALPNVLNPPEGWIVTANQAAIGPDYPFFITDDWSYGARSQRIVDLIEQAIAAGTPLTADRMRSIQMDAQNELALFLAPRLVALPTNERTAPAAALLDGWDGQQAEDSAAAAYFNAVWRQLVHRMFDSAAGTDLIPASGNDQYWQVVENIWDTPGDFWWDDKTVNGTQTRDETLQFALAAAAEELAGLQGSDPATWRWGDLHTLTLTNGTLGSSGVAPIEAIFNRGPVPTSGGLGTVDATGWTPAKGYQVDWVPSMRQVIDLSDLDASTWVNLTGQSGHAFDAHYEDQTQAWRTGAQYPWPFTKAAVDAATTQTLVLLPSP